MRSNGSFPEAKVIPSFAISFIISGVAMAVIYFLLIQYGWKSGAGTLGNVIVAVIGFVIFAGVVYGIDRFKYQRHLRKQKPSSK